MIVFVQFKGRTDVYGGMKFSYNCNLDVRPGDIVRVPTKYGETTARVAEINVMPSRIDDSILAVLKTVKEIVPPEPPAPPKKQVPSHVCEGCAEFTPIGEGDHICGADPFRMVVSDYQPTDDYYWCEGRRFAKQ